MSIVLLIVVIVVVVMIMVIVVVVVVIIIVIIITAAAAALLEHPSEARHVQRHRRTDECDGFRFSRGAVCGLAVGASFPAGLLIARVRLLKTALLGGRSDDAQPF